MMKMMMKYDDDDNGENDDEDDDNYSHSILINWKKKVFSLRWYGTVESC